MDKLYSILLMFIVILPACLIIPIILEKRGIGAGYVYEIAFSLVSIIFVICLVYGILNLLVYSYNFHEIVALVFISGAVLSIPFVFVLGRKAFRKRTKEEVERVYDEGTRSTHNHIEKTSIGLDENVAGLLCYLLGWVSGIFFILIERKNNLVRFHAMQSVIVFSTLMIVYLIIGFLPWSGLLLEGVIFAIVLGLWVFLMVKALEGKKYKLPWAGDPVERWLRTAKTSLFSYVYYVYKPCDTH